MTTAKKLNLKKCTHNQQLIQLNIKKKKKKHNKKLVRRPEQTSLQRGHKDG